MIDIRTMDFSDIRHICTIHMEQFPHSRSTKLGKPFVKKMYSWFILNQKDLALVAEMDGRVVGFIVGSIGGYGRKIFRFAFFEIIYGFIMNPGMLFSRKTFNLWNSFLLGLLPNHNTAAPKNINDQIQNLPIKVSLSSIAVQNSVQGNGIGSNLLKNFEQKAILLGAETLSLSVESYNLSAIHLYEKNGWYKERIDQKRGSIHYIKILNT